MLTSSLILLSVVAVGHLQQYDKILTDISEAVKKYKPCKVSNKTGCSLCHLGQITRDLAPWHDGITQNDVSRAARFGVRYQLIGGELYRSKDCMFPFRCSGVEHFLLELADKLPDLDLVVNVRDYPQSTRGQDKLPVFSFSKVPKTYYDISYPAWTFWEGGPAISIYPTGIGRWDLMRESLISEAERTPWSSKDDRAFFRGSRTSGERDPLVRLSRRNPAFVDAQYTKNQAWKSEKDTLGMPPAAEASFEEHCQYKYLFNFRGVAASFRFKHLFLCGSLVFHVAPEKATEDWIEFFYPSMKPWVHYVPITVKQLENAEYLLNFARTNQEVAREIAQRGQDFIRDHLRLEDITCYWEQLLKKYQKLLKFEVKKDKSLVLIKNPLRKVQMAGTHKQSDRDEL